MAALTSLFGVLSVKELQLGIAIAGMGLMAIHASGGLGVASLPLAEKGVEVAGSFLSLL